MKKRPIDKRFKPPVKGLDLWQAMNYIALDDVSLDFVYNRFTSATVCHTPGSRPVLEKAARKICRPGSVSMKGIAALAEFIATQVKWAGYYALEKGRPLPPDRNLTEEEILASGFGWCNEQARLLCGLALVSGIPSRLVFACDAKKQYGHVVTEMLTDRGWMLVDQSFGYCFVRDGKPVNAWEVFHVPAMAKRFGPIYRAMCEDLQAVLGYDILSRDGEMLVAPNPLDGFAILGYCNHFV